MTLPQPRLKSSGKILESDEATLLEDVTIYELDGKSGYLDWVIMKIVTPAVNSSLTFLDIYCDDTLAFHLNPENMNDMGLCKTTPPLYVLEYNLDGVCQIMLTCRFPFTKNLKIGVRNNLTTQPVVSVWAYVVVEAQ